MSVRAWVLAAASALAAAPALAQAQPSPDPDAIARARALNKKAEDLFAIAEYDRAITSFKEAYELAPTPGLLFNIAQAYRLKGPSGCKSAVRFYRNYLLALPDGPHRATVDAHLRELEPCPDPPPTDGPTAAPVMTAPPTPAPFRPVTDGGATRPRPWPYLTAIGGGALAVTGGVLYLVADRKYQALADGACARRDCPESTWSRYRWMERAGLGLLAGGGAIALAGAVWVLVQPPAAETTAATAWSPWATAEAVGVAASARF